MIVAFDASVLVFVIDANANAPTDPDTGVPVDRCQERVNHLIAALQDEPARIVIPTPALAEVLVRAASAGPELLRIFNGSKHFRIADFDTRAAVEFAARQAERVQSGGRAASTTRDKAKFDDQIVAIAAVEGVETIFSDDKDIRRLAEGGFTVTGIKDLPLPPEDAQPPLPFHDTRREEESKAEPSSDDQVDESKGSDDADPADEEREE